MHLYFNTALLNKRRQAHEHRLTSMKQYVTSKIDCRSQMLLAYFGEKNAERCGICDVCLKRKRLDLSTGEFEEIAATIKRLLSQKPIGIAEIVRNTIQVPEEKTMRVIQFMLDCGELEMKAGNAVLREKQENKL